jgi:PD-(D/E)XK endonuclease
MLTSSQKGAIAEAHITAEAMKLGIVVWRPVAEGCRYDMILDVGGTLLRTQCKWARRNRDVIVVRTYSAEEIDGIAVWCEDTGECYFIPIADVDGQGYLHLRVAPARNNQELLVHWAAKYRLGAIAQLGERRRGTPKVAGSSPASSTSEGSP